MPKPENTPYEIMRRPEKTGGEHAAAPQEQPEEPLESGGRAAILLRIPQGYAVMAVVAVVVLVVMAYAIGHKQGYNSGKKDILQQIEAARSNRNPTEAGKVYGLSDADLRQEGMQYMVVGPFHFDEQRVLADDLAELGFDVLIRPGYNALFDVWVLQGFAQRDQAFEDQVTGHVLQWGQEQGFEVSLQSQISWRTYDSDA